MEEDFRYWFILAVLFVAALWFGADGLPFSAAMILWMGMHK
jgi:hypothetical protein